ncbi:sigma-70 family RNA polymerase sigma factor [Saccharothrix sp. 6-C]|nr:sigma-70 family RNA polymerase sigma factor [Saccharothrix sp. 6-C]
MPGTPTGFDPEPHWLGLEGAERHAACLLAARAGDRRALDAVIADLTPLVWHVARGHGLDRATAEDVVQTVWLALLRDLDRVADPRALAGWLVVTARREAKRTWTPARREASVSDDTAELVGEYGLPEDAVLLDGRDRRLWRAFGRLSQRCQELLRLGALAGRAGAEAPAAPRGSLGPSRGRCLDVLRAHLDAETGWPGLPSPARPQHPPRDPRVRLRSDRPVVAGAPTEVEFGYTVVRDALTTSGHDTAPVSAPVRVLLHVEGATVEPLTRVFRLPADVDAESVRFRVVPGARGTLELVFRVYLGDGHLLQEVRADLPVGEA